MLERTLELLHRNRIRLLKQAGQHQVIDMALLERMVNYADLSSNDVVLEIGAGIGNLTSLLAQRAKKVIAVERDRRFARILRESVGHYKNVEIIMGDILKLRIPSFDKVVANLPYGISSEITFKLLEQGFKLAVMMYQREFARRLVAHPGSDGYGRLTVMVYYRAEVELLEEVQPSAFFPQPKVFSAVVRLRPRRPPFRVANEKLFSDMVRALFQHRRQKVRNAIYHSFHEVFGDLALRKSERRRLIEKIFPRDLLDQRVIELTPEKIGEIVNCLSELNP